MLETLLEELTAGQLTGGATLLTIIVTTVIEKVESIKFKPWSWFFGILGKAMNKEVLEMNKEVLDKVDELEKQVQEIKDDAEEREAKAARSSILRFGDECLHDVKHSKEHFDQIMRDIDAYETYCDTHPDFENNQAVHTIHLINEIYHDRLKDHSFL